MILTQWFGVTGRSSGKWLLFCTSIRHMLSSSETLDNARTNSALLSFLTTDWSSLQSGRYVSKHDVNKVTGLAVYTTIPQGMMLQKCAHICARDRERESTAHLPSFLLRRGVLWTGTVVVIAIILLLVTVVGQRQQIKRSGSILINCHCEAITKWSSHTVAEPVLCVQWLTPPLPRLAVWQWNNWACGMNPVLEIHVSHPSSSSQCSLQPADDWKASGVSLLYVDKQLS